MCKKYQKSKIWTVHTCFDCAYNMLFELSNQNLLIYKKNIYCAVQMFRSRVMK